MTMIRNLDERVSRHLIAPIREPMAIRPLRDELQAAHDFLAKAAKETVPRLQDIDVARWGALAKRQFVRFEGDPPSRLSRLVQEHSFAEVMNQCATLERLIDAMAWAERELPSYRVKLCNPTTSSSSADDDHDLVLVDRKELAKFEISDVASTKDGNRKERKELVSLGVITPHGKPPSAWPEGRLFLVVSPEFGSRLENVRRKLKSFQYRRVGLGSGETCIFEILPVV